MLASSKRLVHFGSHARWQFAHLQFWKNRDKVPADGNFVTAIQRGNHKAGEIQGQTRQHARLINLLGVKCGEGRSKRPEAVW